MLWKRGSACIQPYAFFCYLLFFFFFLNVATLFTGRSLIYLLFRFHFSYVLFYVLRVKDNNMLIIFLSMSFLIIGVNHLIVFFEDEPKAFLVTISWFVCLSRRHFPLPPSPLPPLDVDPLTLSRSCSTFLRDFSSGHSRSKRKKERKDGETGMRTIDPWRRVDK